MKTQIKYSLQMEAGVDSIKSNCQMRVAPAWSSNMWRHCHDLVTQADVICDRANGFICTRDFLEGNLASSQESMMLDACDSLEVECNDEEWVHN